MIYEATDNFFVQKIKIENIEKSRFDFFKELCANKKVLHIGCADTMFFSTDNNLHIMLKDVCKELHGMDLSTEELSKLQEFCPGIYYNDIKECIEEYDLIIIPEVLEHVLNADEFLINIFNIKSKNVFISVPNIMHYCKEMIEEDSCFTEIIHPDHKYWFSPYTLYNIVKKYIKNEDKSNMYYLESKSMVAININMENCND